MSYISVTKVLKAVMFELFLCFRTNMNCTHLCLTMPGFTLSRSN